VSIFKTRMDGLPLIENRNAGVLDAQIPFKSNDFANAAGPYSWSMPKSLVPKRLINSTQITPRHRRREQRATFSTT
jgi:hypothetical protein